MSTHFRINRFMTDTSNGNVVYDFNSDLTVLAGHTGVGKTTLLELIKFSLGGDGHLASVVSDHVLDAHVEIEVGRARYRLSRAVDLTKRDRIRVTDLITEERLRDHTVGGGEPRISDLLMTALDLPVGLKAAARGGQSTRVGSEITFNDIFKYMYIAQSEINRDIALSRDGYYGPKRLAVFELLFGLTNIAMLEWRSELNSLKNRLAQAKSQLDTVKTFLDDVGTTEREAVVQQIDAAVRRASESETVVSALRSEVEVSIDRESKVLRELLTEAERAEVEASRALANLARERDTYLEDRRRLESEGEKLRRMREAGQLLASIEFVSCPRCTQRVDRRTVPEGVCRVCLQPDVIQTLPDAPPYEERQLAEQLKEVDEQLAVIELQSQQTVAAVDHRRELVSSLTTQIDERTARQVTPRLDAFATAVATIERSMAEQESLEGVLRQWDRVADLEAEVDEVAMEQRRVKGNLEAAEAALRARRTEVVRELTAEFQQTVGFFAIPGVEAAEISEETFLPILNGRPFQNLSSAGGIITATQVAYWLTLLTVAARRRDTAVPMFLILDSPRLALNHADDIAEPMYRRFVRQVSVSPGRLQFIVADNELPKSYGMEFTELVFSYENATISSIRHPGPANIELVFAVESS